MKTVLISVVACATLSFATQSSADGKDVYAKACAVCHAVLPPKLGDKATWEPRMQQGKEALIAAVMKGKGAMPPKAGNSSLSEDDIKAAVDYMLEQIK